MTARFNGQVCVAGFLAAVWTFGAAGAADLPAPMYTKAPPPPIMYIWTGFYGGVNIGGSWGHQDSSLTSTATGVNVLTNSLDLNGLIGGGQVGYNWQGNSGWVFGLEADIQGSAQRADGSFFIAPIVGGALIPGSSVAYQDKLDWFGTVRGRLGHAMGSTGRWLPYITGGLAYGQGNINGSGNVAGIPVAFNSSNTYVGWTIGAGIEWAFADRWSAKAEYLYIDFGNGPTVPLTPAANLTTGHMTDNIGRFGVNYRF